MSVQSLQVVLGQVSSGITLFDIKAAAFHFVESTSTCPHCSSLAAMIRMKKTFGQRRVEQQRVSEAGAPITLTQDIYSCTHWINKMYTAGQMVMRMNPKLSDIPIKSEANSHPCKCQFPETLCFAWIFPVMRRQIVHHSHLDHGCSLSSTVLKAKKNCKFWYISKTRVPSSQLWTYWL